MWSPLAVARLLMIAPSLIYENLLHKNECLMDLYILFLIFWQDVDNLDNDTSHLLVSMEIWQKVITFDLKAESCEVVKHACQEVSTSKLH